ncbi:MAG: hypothetical protein O9325_11895 [Roseomonas sp.]|nr:hypothetical protein [Roseomonas sp.]
MNRNLLVIVIAVLGIGASALGYWLYQEQHRPGIDISISPRGVTAGVERLFGTIV